MAASSGTVEIRFYRRSQKFFDFTNFARYPITLDGQTWPTSEHYFQAAKFDDWALKKKIRDTSSPGQALKIGRDSANASRLRKDWDSYRLVAMKAAVSAKFTQHEALRQMLLDTEDAILIEDSPVDAFWGCGADGQGKNHLGRILMEVRSELQNETATSDATPS